MFFALRRLTLVKRYLIGSLFAAIVPLAVLAIMYDRYSSLLLNSLLIEKIDGDLEAASVKMTSFIETQIKRLDNLVDLPEIAEVFVPDRTGPLPDRLLDFLYLEVGSPDIYGVEFFALDGTRTGSVPTLADGNRNLNPDILPVSTYGDAVIIGPGMPGAGAPGWFLIRKDVLRDGRKIGAIALRTRLASLTEQAAALYRPNIYRPHISTPSPVGLSVVGTPQEKGPNLLATAREIMPGWELLLIRSGRDIEQPRLWIRYSLMIGAALSAIGVIWLFVHMSGRLARIILPLNEGARAIARGDFSKRVSEDAPGELKTLARSFNVMCSQLDNMIRSRVDVERRAALGNIAAGVAHEIRNPMTTIGTTIHSLKYAETDPEKSEMLEVIGNEVLRVDGIIEEFLRYARPSEPRLEPTAIRRIFNSIEALTMASATEANVKMTLLGDSSLMVLVDPSHFRQILINAVLNAIEAMPDGGHLTLRAQRREVCAQISISDTGIGIAEDVLKKVFVPFYTTNKKGSGLGLAICAQLAKSNNGSIEIESQIGIGTNLTIKLPLANSFGKTPSGKCGETI
jgi:two-component system, NtrC family, sensor histidine kinase HydH